MLSSSKGIQNHRSNLCGFKSVKFRAASNFSGFKVESFIGKSTLATIKNNNVVAAASFDSKAQPKSSIIVVLVVVRAGTLRSPIATALDCTIPNSVFEDLLYPNLVGVAPGAASGGVGVVPQQHNMLNMDAELRRARGFMRDRIFSILLHRQSQLIDETTRMKFRDISTRLEEGLFKAAHTKEDYMNMETLEPRLSSLIKSRSGNNHTQRHQQLVNSTSSIATMTQQHNMLTMDSELLRARGPTRDRIFSILLHRQSQPIDETTRMKFREISKRLEEGLFKAAHTKEDYMNMETLEPPACLKV
ncbi:hypothetical protein LWI29_033535 [Acer saccharum]|uniref:Uncharacterized protein n=1 Tax=Acer saccharum TaxID=4024 RepID=A0AA39VGY6_ACESA|nr:hypothetical protein LWI29_033535 [Acer saccharum]